MMVPSGKNHFIEGRDSRKSILVAVAVTERLIEVTCGHSIGEVVSCGLDRCQPTTKQCQIQFFHACSTAGSEETIIVVIGRTSGTHVCPSCIVSIILLADLYIIGNIVVPFQINLGTITFIDSGHTLIVSRSLFPLLLMPVVGRRGMFAGCCRHGTGGVGGCFVHQIGNLLRLVQQTTISCTGRVVEGPSRWRKVILHGKSFFREWL
mmetsp:Transcript_12869/g.30092  ORF Transcript_12869/g.30092 Transcript_12869/m.30092 type:complete len:207 (-) Transcript_12869:1251-1871(-)